MSAWYYVVDGDPAFLTAEPADGAAPGRPIAWPAALAAVRAGLGGATLQDGCFELGGRVWSDGAQRWLAP